MSGAKLQVTLSATDQITPTTKTIIASLEQFLNQLKLTDAGLTGIQGKMRTAFASTGATQLFPTQQITQFSAGLNQVGMNLDATGAKAQASTSKFAAFGSALMANGTAFGVAGASAFGLFNAIDNLEKVQLRASTATLRSTTATTALSTAELALANAKATGTASTEQIALLEQRVADARERVGVTTQRAAIFQQDYTEALAGLALQVGPQVIALGGSLAQVYTTLSNTFKAQGGFINVLKTAYQSLAGTQVASNVSGTASISIFRGMAAAEATATVATRGLSTAMKGLLAATGVGIAVVIGTSLFEAFSAGADEAKTNAEALGTTVDATGQKFDEFGNTVAGAVKDLPAGFKELETTMTDIGKSNEDFAKQFVQNIAFIVNGTVKTISIAGAQAAETGRQQLESLNKLAEGQIHVLEAKQLMLKQAVISQKASGVDTTGVQAELDAIQPKIDSLKTSVIANNAEMAKSAPITNAFGSGVADLATKVDIGKAKMEEWFKQQVANRIQLVGDLITLRDYAKAHGTEIPAAIQNDVAASKAWLAAHLGVGPLLKDEADKEKLSADSLEIKANAMRLVTAGYIGQTAAAAASVGELEAFNTVLTPGIVGLQQKAAALVQVQTANQVANATTIQTIQAYSEEIIALTNVGAIYDQSATSILALATAKAAGATAAQDFVTKIALERTTLDQTTASLLKYITGTEGIIIPANLTPTLGLLQEVQKEYDATGAAAITLAQANKTQLAPSFAVLADALGKSSVKEFNKSFKEIEFGDIPNKLEKALQQGGQKMQKFAENAREIFNTTGALIEETMAGVINNKTFDAGIDSITKRLATLNKGQVEGIQPIIEALKGLTELPIGEAAKQLALLNPVIELIAKNSADGKNSVTDINEELALFTKITSDSANVDAFAKSTGGLAASMELLKTRVPTPADLASIERLHQQFLGKPQGPDESFKLDEKNGKDGKDGETVVPAPTKATDFDTKKAAIIKEITDIGLTVVTPTVVPAPIATAFIAGLGALGDLVATAVPAINLAFTAIIVPSPNPIPFIAGLGQIQGLVAPVVTAINTAFIITVPAPITAPFVTGLAPLSNAVLAVITDMSLLQTPLVVPAPDVSSFTDAFTTAATDATDSLQEIIDFVADDLSTSFTDLGDLLSSDITDTFSQFATDSTDSLQEIVDFLNDDLTTAFTDLQSTGESVASAVATAMADITSAAQDAKSAVDDLISALNSIPTDITVTIHIKVVGDPSGGVKGGASGYHGMVDEPTMFLAGESGRERIDIQPLTQPDTSGFVDDTRQVQNIPSVGKTPTPPEYTQPPAMAGQMGPMVANITIPVYVNGQYQGTQQTTKILRDMGAFLA
jgi:hypothetical protein